ncbi:hypothetical protein DIPPA_01623 [Diplonema papillatum]|nr:hypothetical protein DIPPA_01623 [Diplonema papillatum]
MSARGSRVYSGSDDGTVIAWNSETGACIDKLSHTQFAAPASTFTSVSTLACHPVDEHVVVTGVDRSALVWRKAELTHRKTGHTEYPIKAVLWLQAGDYYLTCVRKPVSGSPESLPDETALKVFDSLTGELKLRLRGADDGAVNSVKTGLSEGALAAAMENGSLVFWDLAAAFAAVPPGISTGAAPADWPATRVLRTAFAHTASLVSFMVQPARTQLPPAASGQDPEPSQPSSPFGHSSTFAAAVGDGNSLHIFSTRTWELVGEYVFHSKIVALDTSPLPSTESSQIAAGDTQGRLYFMQAHRL